MPPRITSIKPMTGSLAGGTDLTVLGTGFGADASVLEIEVAGVACAVTQINTDGVHCRLGARPAADPVPTRPMPTAALGNDLGSFVGERGVRWQWAGGGGQSMLLTSFAIPSDCALGCGSGWRPACAPGGPSSGVEAHTSQPDATHAHSGGLSC